MKKLKQWIYKKITDFLKWIWEKIKSPFIALKKALKRVKYLLEIKHRTHTIYILLICLHWIYAFTYITGTNFYEEYTRVAEAKEVNLVRQVHANVAKSTVQKDEVYPPVEQKLTSEQLKAEIIKIAEEKDFKWVDYLLRLSTCENPNHVLDLKANAGNVPATSIDRGLYGINSYHHAEVSDECANNLRCATEWTMWMIESGEQGQWCCDELVLNNPNKYNW